MRARLTAHHAGLAVALCAGFLGTVLIAASFCMFNRYVDGLATWAWPEKEKFMEIGGKMAHEGYMEPYVPENP